MKNNIVIATLIFIILGLLVYIADLKKETVAREKVYHEFIEYLSDELYKSDEFYQSSMTRWDYSLFEDDYGYTRYSDDE